MPPPPTQPTLQTAGAGAPRDRSPRKLRALTRRQGITIVLSAALVAASGSLSASGAAEVPRFAVSALALAALAALVGESLDQLGQRMRPGPTGLLQASLGNLPELLFSVFALRAGLVRVVQAALIGSVLGNLLLVLGLAFVSGAARLGTQKFEPEGPRMSVALLTLAIASMAVPTLAVKLHTPALSHAASLSDVASIVLLVVYVASIPFWLAGGPPRPQTAPTGVRTPPAHLARNNRGRWPLPLTLALLVAATAASAPVSDWFVAALKPATRALGISPVFAGLVIVAVASNAVEHAAGVWLAWKGRPDYAISTILNSPLQIALLLTPLLVLISPALGPTHLLLVFQPLLVAAVAISTLAVGIVIYDGEYSWLEGISLVALYAIIASAFWWG